MSSLSLCLRFYIISRKLSHGPRVLASFGYFVFRGTLAGDEERCYHRDNCDETSTLIRACTTVEKIWTLKEVMEGYDPTTKADTVNSVAEAPSAANASTALCGLSGRSLVACWHIDGLAGYRDV